jgi:hypothetical protein
MTSINPIFTHYSPNISPFSSHGSFSFAMQRLGFLQALSSFDQAVVQETENPCIVGLWTNHPPLIN